MAKSIDWGIYGIVPTTREGQLRSAIVENTTTFVERWRRNRDISRRAIINEEGIDGVF